MTNGSRTPQHAHFSTDATPPTPIAGTAGTPSHMSTKRRRNRGRAPLIVLAVVLVLGIMVYGAGAVAFSQICYPNTHVADVDVSLMSLKTASSRVETAAKSYRLKVAGDGFEWSYQPESPDEVIDAAAAVKHIIDSNEPFAWPLHLFQALNAATGTSTKTADSTDGSGKDADTEAVADLPAAFDQQAFSDSLGQAVDAFNAGRTGTFDAAGAYDEDAGKFTLEKARSNRQLDKEAITKAALTAVATLSSQVKLDDSSFIPLAGGATDEQLKAACDTANTLIGTDVNLKMGGTTVATLDGKQLMQWMTFDDKLSPTLNTEPVTAWVRELAKNKLDTVGSDRTYTRPDGKTITVGGGTYGWNSNEAELVKMLQDAVANKKVGDIEIPTLQTAAKFTDKGKPDWGAYVDIDLTEQYARYYDASGKVLWESGVITGNPNKDWTTPTGIYMLNSNNGASVLLGAPDPKTGKPSYESPVSYWMPFVGNMVGLHDATWQASYSFSDPNALYSVGSRGCVNLPLDKAKQLSAIIHVGDCVITHY